MSIISKGHGLHTRYKWMEAKLLITSKGSNKIVNMNITNVLLFVALDIDIPSTYLRYIYFLLLPLDLNAAKTGPINPLICVTVSSSVLLNTPPSNLFRN